MQNRWLTLLFLAASACTSSQKVQIGFADNGAQCALVSDCKAGLTCKNKTCAALPALGTGHGRGDACDTNTPCDQGLACGSQGLCTLSAPQTLGGACVLKEDCNAGLICTYAGACDNPNENAPGYQDPNSSALCGATDCQRPYVCGANSRCTTLPISGGVDCSLSDLEVGDFRFYFEVPKLPDPNVEFYRLPFPNDIRRTASGTLDLSGFYSPGEILGVNVTGDYLDTVQNSNGINAGYALNTPVFLRASGKFNLSNICLSLNSNYPVIPPSDQVEGLADEAFDPNCTSPSVIMLNIDPAYAASSSTALHDQYGQQVPVEMDYGRVAGHYICQNWIGVAPRAGRPLNPNTTYALLVTSDIKATWGDTPIRDADFISVMRDSPPLDPRRPELGDAWTKMAPLRAFLKTQSADFQARVVGGTVLTTGTPMAGAPPLHSVVYAQPTPTFDGNTTLCDGSHVSPCDDGFALAGSAGFNPNHLHLRGCPSSVNPNYSVFQGRFGPNPVMQSGTRPYTTSADGGGLVLDANGTPTPQGTESMCYALSVPNKPPPAGGWPVVIYAHGTGGAFSTFLTDGTADIFANNFAIISYDNVLHGWRQNNDPNAWSPDAKIPLLFFNISNAKASRDNIWQGSADLHTITRLVHSQALNIQGLNAPLVLGSTVNFDPNAVYYVGHSQGTVVAPPYLVTNTAIQAAILAGAGAELPLSLLTKTQPVNVAQLLGVFFGDRSVQRVHPMMGMISQLFAGVDAVSYAPSLVTSPFTQKTLPLYEVMGLLDTYAPDVTQQALAVAAGLPLVSDALEPFDGMVVAKPPPTVADGAIQYNTNGAYDGHFVMFRNPLAQQSVRQFLLDTTNQDPKITP